MVPITGGISETRSESSSQSLPQQQYEGGTLWKRLGVFSEEQLMVPVHTMSCNVIIYTTLVSRYIAGSTNSPPPHPTVRADSHPGLHLLGDTHPDVPGSREV